MDNLRRRTERDVKDAKTYSVAAFARDMLGVSDNLRRALDAIPAEARTGGDAGFVALVEGVEMTERSMLGALERHGVKKIEPTRPEIRPHFHQAMFEVPNPEIPANTVIQVVQTAMSSAIACCVPPWSASPRAAQGRGRAVFRTDGLIGPRIRRSPRRRSHSPP